MFSLEFPEEMMMLRLEFLLTRASSFWARSSMRISSMSSSTLGPPRNLCRAEKFGSRMKDEKKRRVALISL